MKDFQVVRARVLLNVSGVSPIRGFVPPSVMIVGKDLNQATQIFYNGVEVVEFVISSPTRIIAKIPDSELGQVITELQVFSDGFLTKDLASLTFELVRPLKKIEGLQRLVQSWMILLFTTPGTDVWSPNSGGGIRSIIGRNTNHAGKGVTADLALAIDRTNAEMKRLQAGNGRLPLSEKLLSGNLQGIDFDDSTTTLSASVVIKNMLGESAEASIR